MKELMVYVLKSGICLSAVLIVYQLFLRKTTFFKFNRAYLLMGIILSLIVPSIHYSYDVLVAQTVSVMPIPNNITVELIPTNRMDAWFVISLLYIIGVTIIIGRSIFSYRKLYNLLKKGTKVKEGDFSFIDNPTIESPFSVFTFIVLNSQKLSTREKDIILKHEKTHINQHHWIDLLLSELMLAFQWFNPAYWAYVKMQKENHEFLADKAVIDAGTSAAVYQAVLLNQQFGGPVFSFTNSFYFSNKLNRLDMMKKTKSAPWKRIAVLAIVPVLGMFVWASATPNYVVAEPKDKQKKESAKKDETANTNIVVVGYGKKDSPLTISMSSGEGSTSMTATNKDGVVTLASDENSIPENILYILDGKEISKENLDKIPTDDIDNINVFKDAKLGVKGKNGVILITTKKKTSRLMQYDVLYIIDGKEATKTDLEKLDEGTIRTWTHVNEKEGEEKYGEKGKKGAIQIETKKK